MGSGCTKDQKLQAEELLEFANEFYLNQYITEPTRRQNILDLFFTNNEDLILKIKVEPPTILSDHNFQVINTSFAEEIFENINLSEDESISSFNFSDNQIDWADINIRIASLDWGCLFSGKSPTEMYGALYKHLYLICAETVPKKVFRPKTSIPKDRKILMRNRSNLNKKYYVSNEQGKIKCLSKISKIEKKLIDSHALEEQTKESKAISKIKILPYIFLQLYPLKIKNKNLSWTLYDTK